MLYEYRCPKCGQQEERQVPYAAADNQRCTTCTVRMIDKMVVTDISIKTGIEVGPDDLAHLGIAGRVAESHIEHVKLERLISLPQPGRVDGQYKFGWYVRDHPGAPERFVEGHIDKVSKKHVGLNGG